MAEELRLTFLGGAQICHNGVALDTFVSSKAPALLCYLAVTGRPHSRTALAGLLWSDLSEDAARGNLRTVLANLRHTLASHLTITRDTVAFDRTSSYWLDIEQVEAALSQSASDDADRLRAAIALYTGDFLEGFVVRDAPLFDEWVVSESERLRQRVLHALHEFADHHLAHGEYAAGIDACTRLLQLDPWREDTHRQLMCLLALSGQRDAALAQYAACCRVLQAELGAEVSEETNHLYEQIRNGAVGPARSGGAAEVHSTIQPARRLALPTPASTVVGRELELAQIAQRLAEPTCRLLTLTGPGGIGKTRLALHAAAEHAATLPDGVVWASLIAAGSREQMVTGIADALGLALHGQHNPEMQVLDYLRDKRLLLLLDNLEHLRDASSFVHAIVTAAPQVVVVATSRERLNLQAEWLLDVRGLLYPIATHEASDKLPDWTQLERYAAVQLFVQRATQVQPDWTLDDATAPAVIRICQLVQGMPLGIELAAAWVRTTSCTEIADEIAQNLDFLATTMWDVPARHRSLRAVFDYSWQLLSAEQRATQAQFAVFCGGFGSEAAKVVVGADLRRLASLIDTSLLYREAGGRYVLHELVRQFAAERLATDWPELAQQAHERHSAFYLDIVRGSEAALRGTTSQQIVAKLRADLDNIREAWRWAVAATRLDTLDQAIGGLATLYELNGLVEEGAAVFGAATEQARGFLATRATLDRAWQRVFGRLLVAYARFLTYQARFHPALAAVREAQALALAAGAPDLEAISAHQAGLTLARHTHYELARAELERALALARAIGLPYLEADSLIGLGETAVRQGDIVAAGRYNQEALERYHALGDQRGEGQALNNLGVLALFQGNYEAGEVYQTEALKCHRAAGNAMDEAFASLCLSQIALARLDYQAAEVFCDQGLQLYRSNGNRYGEIFAYGYRGYVPLQQGDYPAARAAFLHALQLQRSIADRRGESDMLANLSLVAHLEGDDATALALSQQALEIARQLGHQQFQGRALTHLGHALAGLRRLEEADDAYKEALALRRALHQHHLAMEPLAGLARVALARDDLARAQAHVAEILAYLATATLAGMFEPLRVYLTCYQVLRASDDGRAEAVLHTAHNLLQKRAAAVGDAAARHTFLENVTAHREIERAYDEAMQACF